MTDPDIFARDPVYGLPKSFGATELHLAQPAAIATLAPFRGQGIAVADALKKLWKTGLPKTGKIRTVKSVILLWSAPGQWLSKGDFDPVALAVALDGIAAVTDQSDAFAVLHLTGTGAADVMARLSPLDVATLAGTDVARTEIAALAGVVTPIKDGYEIWLPRSAAHWGVDKITGAMERLEATRALR